VTSTPSLPSSVALEDVLRAGAEALARGKVGNALRTFDEALRIKPTYAPAWKAKGRAHRAAGDPKAALECYAQALRYEPGDEGSWFGLALVLHEMGRRTEEMEAYDVLLQRNPRNTAAWMNRGVALHEQGRYEEALASYDKILSFRPEFAPAWNDRGAALIRLGRLEEALTALDEALALDPELADARANRQGVLERLRREAPFPTPIETVPVTLSPATQRRVLANLALAPIELWRTSMPHSADDFASLGTALLDQGKPDGAQAAFAKAITLGAGAEANLGKLLAMQVRHDPGLLDEAARALAAHPEVPRIAIAAATFAEDVGDSSGAVDALGAIVAHRPEVAWIWNWKGILCLKAGRIADAHRAFERAVAEDPDDDEAWTNLAATLHLAGRSEEALAACERGLAVAPASPAAWNNKAVVLAALGRADDAEKALRSAASGGGNGTALLNRARLAETGGQMRAALGFYEEALRALPDDAEALAGRRRVIGHLGAQGRAKRNRIMERLTSIPGLGPATAARIVKAGFDTPAKIQRGLESVLRDMAKLTKAQARAVKRAFSR